LQHNH